MGGFLTGSRAEALWSADTLSIPAQNPTCSVRTVVDDVRGDTRDYAQVEASMAEFAPEVIFHLAAQSIVMRSYADPLTTYSTNVMGTVHVPEAVRKAPNVRAVVCITTDKVYHNQEWVWPYRETDALGGHGPYSTSKACAELVCEAYRNSYFPIAELEKHQVLVASVRAGNVIGRGDWSPYRLVPDLVLLKGCSLDRLSLPHPSISGIATMMHGRWNESPTRL